MMVASCSFVGDSTIGGIQSLVLKIQEASERLQETVERCRTRRLALAEVIEDWSSAAFPDLGRFTPLEHL